jgi:hypothetical protein
MCHMKITRTPHYFLLEAASKDIGLRALHIICLISLRLNGNGPLHLRLLAQVS